jgi:Protein of unknown function (DUF3168)
MSAFSQLPLQTAIYAKLTGDATLMGMIAGVYDRPPQGAAFPYITIGDSASKDASNKAVIGTEHKMALHVWSRQGGRAETATIMDRLYQLLNQGTLSINGQTLVAMYFTAGAIALETDGETYHGTLALRIVLQAN